MSITHFEQSSLSSSESSPVTTNIAVIILNHIFLDITYICTNTFQIDSYIAIVSNATLQGRSAVKCVKRVKGKKGKPDRIELLVTIDLVNNVTTIITNISIFVNIKKSVFDVV